MKLIKKENRDLLYLSIVLIFAITLSIFSVSIRFIEKLYSFFEIYTRLPIADVLINFNFLYLSGLILLLYRRWRKAAIKQEELENVINSITPYVLIVADQERNIIMCSSSLKRMYGYEVNEVINRKTDLLYSDMLSNPKHNSEILDILREEGFYAGLAEGKKKDGKTIPLEIITGNLRGRGGSVSLLKEITQRRRAEEELKASEARFRNLVEATSDWVWEVDAQGIYTYASPKVKDIMGYEISEVLGKTPFDLMPEEEAEKIRNFFEQKVINKEPFYRLENINLHKDGHLVVLETSGIPIFDEKGLLKGYRGIDRDVTERKKAEETRWESEKLYKAVVENIADAIVINVGTKRVFVNNAYQALHGLHDVSQTLELPLGHFILPEDRQFVHEQILARQTGHPLPGIYQYRICRPDGEVRTVEASAVPITYKTQPAALAVLRDITERKQVEDALRIKDWAIESSINGIGIADLEGYLTYANNAFFKMWGYDEKEVLGKHVLKFCQKEDEVTEVMEELQDEGWVGEMKARRKDGSLLDVSVSASVVKEKDDNPVCMMVSFIDITETVQLREKLRAISINDELTGLYNRRGFLNMAEQQLNMSKRTKTKLVLFFIDFDGLKWINDTFGHNEGDQALIDTANILKKTFREVDILARFGGDEFVILATDASKSSAEILTVRLYENLTAHNSKETCRYNLSLSIGISCYDPEFPISLDELISRADSAMYEQKKSKRKIIE